MHNNEEGDKDRTRSVEEKSRSVSGAATWRLKWIPAAPFYSPFRAQIGIYIPNKLS